MKYNVKLLLITVGILLVAVVTDVGCVWRNTLGVPCPGCGLTRAWLAFFEGNLHQAFEFHPLFWTIPIVGLMILFEDKINKRVFMVFTIVFILVFFGTYFYRLHYNLIP